MSHPVSVAVGSMLMVTMRWVDRGIGILSMIVLARLLVPEDFGIIAMATLTVGLVDVFMDLGVNIALIQNENAGKSHYDSAWTIRVFQTCIGSLVIFFFAPIVADYYNDERVIAVLQVLAVGLVISGLENIGIVDFLKKMEFGMEFKFHLIKRFSGFVVTIVLAYTLRSYWALVFGIITTKLVGTGLSYLLHPMRPCLSFSKFKEIFVFSLWVLVRNIGSYLDSRLDKLIVGKQTSASTLGAYSIADEIAALPSTELLAPLNRVLFPALVRVKNNLIELRRVYLLTLGVQSLIVIPAGVGLALVAYEVTYVVLGNKWDQAIPFLKVISFINVATALSFSSGYLLMAIGKVKLVAITTLLQVFIFLLSVLYFLPSGDAMVIAQARLAISGLSIIIFAWLVLKHVQVISLLDMVSATWRPILATGCMYFALHDLQAFDLLPLTLALLLKIVSGGLIYSLTLIFLWLLSGRPVQAESYLLGKLNLAWERIRS